MQTDVSSLLEKIEEFLKENPHGVSIQDVARKFGISRYDAVYVLGMLIGAGKVGVIPMGPVKLHYYKSYKQKGGE